MAAQLADARFKMPCTRHRRIDTDIGRETQRRDLHALDWHGVLVRCESRDRQSAIGIDDTRLGPCSTDRRATADQARPRRRVHVLDGCARQTSQILQFGDARHRRPGVGQQPPFRVQVAQGVLARLVIDADKVVDSVKDRRSPRRMRPRPHESGAPSPTGARASPIAAVARKVALAMLGQPTAWFAAISCGYTDSPSSSPLIGARTAWRLKKARPRRRSR